MNVPDHPETAEPNSTPIPEEPAGDGHDAGQQPSDPDELHPASAEPAALAAAASATATAAPDARAEALAIAELCQLAGQSQRIVGFLAEGATPDQVRQALLASRAESPEIASRLNPDTPAHEASPEHGPLMRAVRRMIGA